MKPSFPTPLPRLKVSDNRRFIVTEQGEPFFWLGDTAWELFHRLTREEARRYLDDRQAKRFTVVQAVALAEFQGLQTPNAYGDLPLIDLDPARPNEAYFALVDEYIRMAAERGLYIGLLPTWGDKVFPLWGGGPVVFDTSEKARAYGRFLGDRYRGQTNVIWILGGDRPAIWEGRDFRPIWQGMAKGIAEGLGFHPLMTYHPMGGHSTSEWLQDEAWLDVHMMQSGHGGGHDVPVWEMIARDYGLSPTRPTLDGEPNYEDHPVNPWPKWDPATGYYRDHDVRKQIYRSVFAGGCGVTYGHHSVWQFFSSQREPVNHPYCTWEVALDRPAARQAQFLRNLMESRPYLTRVPDQSLLACDPGQDGEHVQATRDANGSYAFIYFPVSRPVELRLDLLSGPRLKGWWYDPRTGWADPAGEYPASGTRTFTPPAGGPDWVLALDNLAMGFPAPGSTSL